MTVSLLGLRLVIGLVFVAHGAQKIFGWFGGSGPEGTAAGMARLGFRDATRTARLAGWTELVSGVAIAAGFLVPLSASVVIGVMFVAAVVAHLPKGLMLSAGGYEYNLVLSTAAFALAGVGPGSISADALLGWEWYGDGWALGSLGVAFLAGAAHLSLAWRRPTPPTT